MTHLFISPNNDYPRHPGDILIEHPDWDGTLENLPEGWLPVVPSEVPICGELQTVEEEFPIFMDGKYTQKYYVRDLTTEDLERLESLKKLYEEALNFSNPISNKDNG